MWHPSQKNILGAKNKIIGLQRELIYPWTPSGPVDPTLRTSGTQGWLTGSMPYHTAFPHDAEERHWRTERCFRDTGEWKTSLSARWPCVDSVCLG